MILLNDGNYASKLLNVTSGKITQILKGGFGGSWIRFGDSRDYEDVSWDKVPIFYSKNLNNPYLTERENL